MKVDLDVFSRKECEKNYEIFEFAFGENEMCVGHRNGLNTLCEVSIAIFFKAFRTSNSF